METGPDTGADDVDPMFRDLRVYARSRMVSAVLRPTRGAGGRNYDPGGRPPDPFEGGGSGRINENWGGGEEVGGDSSRQALPLCGPVYYLVRVRGLTIV